MNTSPWVATQAWQGTPCWVKLKVYWPFFSTGGFSALNWVANMPAMVLASEPLLGPTTMVTETPLVALAKMALVMP